jgi:hypothetical protein
VSAIGFTRFIRPEGVKEQEKVLGKWKGNGKNHVD